MGNTIRNQGGDISATLEKNFDYFLANQSDLAKKYPNRILVISNQKVQGDFNTNEEAYNFGVEKFKLGDFIIQISADGEEAYTNYFNPVSFA